MTSRRDEIYELERYRELIEETLSNMFHQAQSLHEHEANRRIARRAELKRMELTKEYMLSDLALERYNELLKEEEEDA